MASETTNPIYLFPCIFYRNNDNSNDHDDKALTRTSDDNNDYAKYAHVLQSIFCQNRGIGIEHGNLGWKRVPSAGAFESVVAWLRFSPAPKVSM